MEAAEIDEGDLDAKLAEQATELEALGIALREKRQTVARKLEVAVQKELADLYMEKTVFKVHFSPVESGRFLSSGLDDVEFYIQPNPGEAMQPLAKIASGGELSRLMLALKTIFFLSRKGSLPSFLTKWTLGSLVEWPKLSLKRSVGLQTIRKCCALPIYHKSLQ